MPLLRPLTDLELTGRSRSHVSEAAGLRCTLHAQVMPAFLGMRAAAQRVGIDLRAASSFRDFDRQLLIWNGKYRGERALLDRAGRGLDVSRLTPTERIEAILVWSALPGASRHHWGTDLDVYDAAAMPDESVLQLVPEEYQEGGPFAKLTEWLDENMQRFGFFRPYVGNAASPTRDSNTHEISGVNPEPWHLSYAPLATHCLRQLTPQLLASVLVDSPLEGREAVLASLSSIHQRYVANVVTATEDLTAFEFGDHGRMV